MPIFVIHGFASATPNRNSEFMEEIFPYESVVGLNYDPVKIDESMKDMIHTVESHLTLADEFDETLVFIGASLGGFIAQYLAREFSIFGAKAILINPAVIPWESLTRWLGKNTNYKTGEEFNLTAEDINAYSKYYIEPGVIPTLVLLDKGDEILDPAVTAEHFKEVSVIEFEGGSHRFEHLEESAAEIKSFVNFMPM